jgi:Kef-type K+ transport system membrane component KefB
MTQHDPGTATPLTPPDGQRSRRAARAIDASTAWDASDEARQDHGPAFGGLVFVACFLLFIAALWLFGYSVDVDNGALFGVAILASGIAFMVPMHMQHR